jgi:alpha-ketoglutaric semialdehyde dehydrogenase
MSPMLVLINLDEESLRAPSLEPAAARLVERASVALAVCRERSIPVAHLKSVPSAYSPSTRASPPKRRSIADITEPSCPHALLPSGVELVLTGTSADRELERCLERLRIETVILCGLQLHQTVRQAALSALGRGLGVWVVTDAVASDDPLHAAISLRHLDELGIDLISSDQLEALLSARSVLSSGEESGILSMPSSIVDGRTGQQTPRVLVHRSPRRPDVPLWAVPICGDDGVAHATASARRAWPAWTRTEPLARASLLTRLADRLEGQADRLAVMLADEIGKPSTQGKGEVVRSAVMLRAVSARAAAVSEQQVTKTAKFRHRSIGAIALISPWNSPLYIPLGKIAPALLFGNTVVWKPAPAGTSIAARLLDELLAVGCPPGVVSLVSGDGTTAAVLMSDPRIDAVTLTGSSLAGFCAQEICGRRRIPLQAELGGNNAAIVWSDCDLAHAARQVAEGAFGMAGQRCTANRRVIVDARCMDDYLSLLERAAADLAWGDPMDPSTQVGPLITEAQRERVAALIARSAEQGMTIVVPHESSASREDHRLDARTYCPPTIIRCPDPRDEVVQEETFGPVLVVQEANGWDQAISLCNGVRQGLAAALFSPSAQLRERFMFEAEAGILKLDRSTADAEVDLPFGGWKASGIGPAEHGECDREFYTRTQTIYS